MEIKSVDVTPVIGSFSQPLSDTLVVGGETGRRVTVGRTVEKLDVEEGVVSAGHPVPVRGQHDAADGVAARTHDHHCGRKNKRVRRAPQSTARTLKPLGGRLAKNGLLT